MSVWVLIGIAVGGVGVLAATRYFTQRIRARQGQREQPYNAVDDAVGQGVINSLLDIFLP